MSVMNKKWLIVGGLVVAILLVIGLSAVNKKISKGTCEQFIAALQQNDAAGAYDLFTNQARASTSLESWKGTASNLYGDLSGGAVTFKNRQVSIDPVSQREETQEEYTVQVGNSKYLTTCHLTGTGGGLAVQAFTSQVDLE